MAKSDKWNKAVAESRGEELATTDAPKSLGALGADGVTSLVRRADAGSLAARMKAGEIEAAVQLLTLEAGTEITARVVKQGKTMLEDINSKEMKEVTTWQLQLLDPDDFSPGPRVSILGSSQLDRQLTDLVGKVCIIARGGDVRTSKSRIMTEYFVGHLTNVQ